MQENKELISDVCVFESGSYSDTSEVKGGVLRRIQGPVAEWGSLNRNSRLYSEQLWDNVLSSSYLKEQLSYHTLYGEACHPQDRYEIDFGRVTHSITNLWKVPEKNQIYATIEILDTPMGRILNTLYEAGGIIGYSSRAGGKLIQKKDHVLVDEKTYNFITFDAVPYPSVISARPSESLNESTNTKEQLPDDVHEKLCKIILESGASRNEQLKEFIYSIDGYDMSKEREIFESSKPSVITVIPGDAKISTSDKVVESEPVVKQTTMSVLQESSSKIKSLESKVLSLTSKNKSYITENANLKRRLDESLEQIVKLIKLDENSKKSEEKVDESSLEFNDTIVGLRDRIEDLESIIEEKNLELEELNDVKEAFKAIQSENSGMKSVIHKNEEIVESYQKELQKEEQDLNEAYSEINSMLKELEQRDSKIQSLNSEVGTLTSKVSTLTSKVGILEENLSKAQEGYISEEDRSRIEEDTQKLNEMVESLKSDNSRLNEEVSRLEKRSNTFVSSARNYAEDLIKVVSGVYGVDPHKVAEKLHEGFTKDDIYKVCESFTNSVINGVSYDTIAESMNTGSTTPNPNSSQANAPKIESIMANAGNRRGIGLIK